MASLFSNYPATIQTEFDNLVQSARTQGVIRLGTPGTIEDRQRRDGSYAYHRYYDANGKPRETYIAGPLGTPAADAARADAQALIERAKFDVQTVKMFRKLNYTCLDDKSNATLGALHNRGLFEAGLTLVGSHAYGILLNSLGVSAKNYLTEDIDLVRLRPLHLTDNQALELIDVLKTSGLPFIKVSTGLRPGDSAVTHKLSGAERLMVDLLVSGRDLGKSVPIPELSVHAQAVPHLDYLVEERMAAVALSKNHIVPVYVPNPSRYAVHKMFSSQSRTKQFSKTEKDLQQAATLICVLEDRFPGDMAEAMAGFPATGRAVMLAGARKVLEIVRAHGDQAADMLADAIGESRGS